MFFTKKKHMPKELKTVLVNRATVRVSNDDLSIRDVLSYLPDHIDKRSIIRDNIVVKSIVEYDGGGSLDLIYTFKLPSFMVVSKKTIITMLSGFNSIELELIYKKLFGTAPINVYRFEYSDENDEMTMMKCLQ